jgi:hypothetical protein
MYKKNASKNNEWFIMERSQLWTNYLIAKWSFETNVQHRQLRGHVKIKYKIKMFHFYVNNLTWNFGMNNPNALPLQKWRYVVL